MSAFNNKKNRLRQYPLSWIKWMILGCS